KLYKEIMEGKVGLVIAEYKDRILRIGFDDFLELCRLNKTEVLIIDESIDKSRQSEIVNDMISIIHHFSAKMYSNRRRKKVEDLVKEIVEEDDAHD
ncbi:MAG: IS607 family transposase, partial [bacterium]